MGMGGGMDIGGGWTGTDDFLYIYRNNANQCIQLWGLFSRHVSDYNLCYKCISIMNELWYRSKVLADNLQHSSLSPFLFTLCFSSLTADRLLKASKDFLKRYIECS